MSTTPPARPASYGPDRLEEAAEGIDAALRSGEGMTLLFVGASPEEKQSAISTLSAPGKLNLHRFEVPNLVGERLVETQGNLREAFDKSDGEAALLFFDHADVLLDRTYDQGEATPKTEQEQKADQRKDQESDALSDYFFERLKAYGGVTVVCFSSQAYVDRLEGPKADAIVTF